MVSMSYVAWLADFIRSYGVSPRQLLDSTNIEERMLWEPAAEITDTQHIAILRNAIQSSNDPALGLELGIHRHISTLDRFGFAMMCCETFREAISVGNEYQRVVGRFSGRSLFLSTRQEGGAAIFQIEVSPDLGDLAQFAVEEIFGSILTSTRWVTDRDLPLRQLCCAYPQPSYAERYRKYFPCPIRFNARYNEIHFDGSFLDVRLPMASVQAARMYRADCQRRVTRIVAGTESLVADIRTRLMASTGAALPLTACAQALAISPRTLRRKLHEGGHSYQDIVDDVRAGQARDYLESSQLTVSVIAERLGFSEPTSFSRAFRRWTGMTPRAFRNRLPLIR